MDSIVSEVTMTEKYTGIIKENTDINKAEPVYRWRWENLFTVDSVEDKKSAIDEKTKEQDNGN